MFIQQWSFNFSWDFSSHFAYRRLKICSSNIFVERIGYEFIGNEKKKEKETWSVRELRAIKLYERFNSLENSWDYLHLLRKITPVLVSSYVTRSRLPEASLMVYIYRCYIYTRVGNGYREIKKCMSHGSSWLRRWEVLVHAPAISLYLWPRW